MQKILNINLKERLITKEPLNKSECGFIQCYPKKLFLVGVKKVSLNLADFIKKGGVFDEFTGSSPEEIYKQVTEKMNLPSSISAQEIFDALVTREKIMSTAVGNGIAIPHCRMPIIKEINEQRVCVVYLKEPIDMNAPDNIPVYVMFVILAQNQQTHLSILSSLVGLFKNPEFRKVLEAHTGEQGLLEAIKNFA